MNGFQPGNAAAFLVYAHPQRQLRHERLASCESSATCSGASMLRAKRITPPSENSRASERILGGDGRGRRGCRSAVARSRGGWPKARTL